MGINRHDIQELEESLQLRYCLQCFKSRMMRRVRVYDAYYIEKGSELKYYCRECDSIFKPDEVLSLEEIVEQILFATKD